MASDDSNENDGHGDGGDAETNVSRARMAIVMIATTTNAMKIMTTPASGDAGGSGHRRDEVCEDGCDNHGYDGGNWNRRWNWCTKIG